MYQHNIASFGDFEKHSLWNPDTKNGFSLVPQRGACLLEVLFDGINLIDGYATGEDLKIGKWSKSAVLCPFPNRLKDGKYAFNGVNYQYDINNAATANAIHGHIKDQNFSVKSVILTENYAAITCVFEDKGTHKAYPFCYKLSLTFLIDDIKGFELEMEVQNIDNQPIPMGLGWHPYFNLGGKSANWLLQLPDCQIIDIDERMLPTGVKKPYFNFEKMTKIEDTVLDNGFYLTKQGRRNHVKVRGEKGELRYWQQAGREKWNFLQVFTPPYGTAIALEPMTCNINAFNNQDGLVILQPQKKLGGRFGFSFLRTKK